MIGPAGGAALAVTLLATVTAALLWARVALLGGSVRPARGATWVAVASAAAACALLDVALVTHDFSIRYVAENGGRDVPLYFRITSLWAALDGSLLLWLLIGTACAAVLATTRRRGALWPWAMTVLSAVTVFFCAVALFAANPFEPVAMPPLDGPGPNPLLREHPAMGLHPPILYLGYVGLVVPFAYAVAAMIVGRADRAAALVLRRSTLVAWTLLTLGITLGAWWSYAVLGWGGYWAWDPVENASLLPWLTATALLHTLLVRPRGHPLWTWPLVLATTSFLLVLLGTFLTRSGVVTSVHAFTASPLGPVLLGFLVLATALVGALMLYGLHRFSGGADGPRRDRRGLALNAQAVLMVIVAVVVLTGTVLPTVLQAAGAAEVTVGPAYFNRAAVPVALVAVLLMGVAPFLNSNRQPEQLVLPLIVGLGTITAVGLLAPPSTVPTLATFGAAAFVLTGLGRAALAPRRQIGLGALVAHAGVAVLAIGIAASSTFATTSERRLVVGESANLAGVTVRLVDIARASDRAGMSIAVRLTVTEADRGHAVAPRLRYFPRHDLTVSIPGIQAGLTRDVYTTVLGVDEDGRAATIRVAVNPLVGLVWAGGFLIALGGALSWYRRRRPRVAAPEPALVGSP